MYDHLIIDGKNSIYRAIFAKHSTKIQWSQTDDVFVILMRFINSYINKFNPSSVGMIWDAPKKQVWRHQCVTESTLSDVLLPYKGHRGTLFESRDFDPEAELQKQLIFCTSMFKHMNIRQYFQPNMEADDLIYAFCRAYPKSKILIVSSDGDLLQIPFMFDNVNVYNPLSKHAKTASKIEPRPDYDIATAKALMGDKSDNILGYYRIGKVTSKQLTNNIKQRIEFLNGEKAVALIGESGQRQKFHVGKELFNTNRQIIDLSACPHLLDNLLYIETKSTADINYDPKILTDLISRYKMAGLREEFEHYFSTFKGLT